MSLLAGKQSLGDKVSEAADSYTALFDEKKDQKQLEEQRKNNYTTLVNHYYDLATDFYEYGWGTSFHFAPRFRGEALAQSLARHEHFLGLKLKLGSGMKVLDVGCGVGGPMMEIARFTRAKITGLNNNAYQISRGRKYVEKNGLEQLCDFMKADFMKIPQPDNTYDAIYAIEATCHAPSKVGIYSEIMRVLKPGALFAAYEWLMTDKYDPQNAEHNKIKRDIELGDGLPNLDTIQVALDALREAGFEIIEYRDLAVVDDINPIAWYQPLVPSWSLSGFRLTTVGRMTSHAMVTGLEKIGIAPQGSVKTHNFLLAAADGLVKGGQQGIFTPMFFFLVRKPLNK